MQLLALALFLGFLAGFLVAWMGARLQSRAVLAAYREGLKDGRDGSCWVKGQIESPTK